ncbi:hypothetical protein [Polyangium sp. 6x1]|uniref:hypothetical protein n=1 Tax=Polyangium sp. 6x1 TaxID=3042689 RepID=UPI002482E386|nr:hypothetical protein [Polyangium sp. 6x1]MDI1451424.1 hypothetical protein [Polyangium sp. 6x1]
MGLLSASSVGCNKSTPPTPEKETPPATLAPQSSASGAPVAERPPAPKVIPTLAAEPFAPEGTRPELLFAIEGGLAVVEGLRVGRIVDGARIEWVGKIEDDNQWLGGSHIVSVYGRFPDAVDVLYQSNQGRAPQPTYFPLTGKGERFRVGDGGSAGAMVGVANVGESTLVAALNDEEGHLLKTVRGPRLVYKFTAFEEGGCKKEEEFRFLGHRGVLPAIPPRAIATTATGALMTVGLLCDKRGAVAEVWDKPGKSRIIDLGGWIKDLDYWPRFLKGSGDDFFLDASAKAPILRYRNGTFEPLPRLDKPFTNVFVSSSGQLHASDGRTIHRYDDGKWTPVALLAWPTSFRAMALEKDTFWASAGMTVLKLRETKSVAFEDGCQAPFVYLYDVAPQNAPDFTFPTTRKALASFEGAADLGLVEVYEGARRLGLTVKSKEQGEAVIAHLKTTMKDEAPTLLCYAPKNPRVIPLKGK